MQANAKWVDGFQSIVDNGRGHSVVLDLPEDLGGDNIGATALELAILGFSGCISTIFAMVCKNSGVEFSAFDVKLNAEKPKGAATVSEVTGTATVTSDADEEKLQKMFAKTMTTCPVGVLFDKAGIEERVELVINR